MLGFIFGFNARLGRLHYFLSTIVLAVVMTLISFGIAGYVFRHLPRGTQPSAEQIMLPALCAGLLFFWVSFNLQAMRIRDIGWDPVVIIPAWITVLVIDTLVAIKIPAWGVGHGHHETIVGMATSLVLIGVLLFWPSGSDAGPMPTAFDKPRRMPNEPDKPRSVTAPAVRRAMATRTEFGQRGFKA